MKHLHHYYQEIELRRKRYVEFIGAALHEERKAEKKEKNAAEDARNEALRIASNIENAEAEADLLAQEQAKEKLKKQTRTIYAGALEDKVDTTKTTFGV